MEKLKSICNLLPPHYRLLTLLTVVILPVDLLRFFSKHYLEMISADYGGFIDYLIYYQAADLFKDNPYWLYSIPEFIYPPPGILMFLPLSRLPFHYAASLHVILMTALMVMGILLALKLYRAEYGAGKDTILRSAVLLIGLACGPVYQNLKGQINPVVFICCLGFLYLLKRNRPAAAGFVLSLGFWIKLYPALLALLGLGKKTRRHFTAGLLAGALLPVMLLHWIPFTLYREFFLERLDAITSVTCLSANNQSIIGFLANLVNPPSQLAHYMPAAIMPWMKTVNLTVGAVFLLIAYLPFLLERQDGTLVSAFCLMALAPALSPLGWEHTYLLALPLGLYLLIESKNWRAGYQFLFAGSFALFMLPKIPDSIISRTCHLGPQLLQCMFYSRYLFVMLAYIAAAVIISIHGSRAIAD